jgi:hypothetical protein
MGGEWETDMGGLATFHIPRDKLDAFQERFGMDPRSGQELFSGVQPWESIASAKSTRCDV